MSDADTRQAVSDAITQAIHGDGDMVTKWVAIIEGFNADGERYIWRMSDDESTPWDRIGLLQFALIRAQADITADDED